MSRSFNRKFAELLFSACIAVALTAIAIVASPSMAAAQTAALSVDQADSATAYNTRTLWLQFPSPPSAEACVSREIYLAAGDYRWEQVASSNVRLYPSYRDIYLAAGTYVWKDCIGTFENIYYHDTYLREQSTGEYAYLNRSYLATEGSGMYWAEFGSSLDRW